MKSKLFLSLALVGVMAVAAIAGLVGNNTTGVSAADTAQPVTVNVGNQQTGIQVSGLGKVTVTPDVAHLNLGVSAEASTVAEAQSQAAAAMDKVVAALKDNGIAQKDIRTQHYNIYQTTRWDERTQQSVPTGYQVSNMVAVKIRNVEKTGAIIDAAVAAGGDLIRINGVSFSVDQPEKHYDQARELAFNDARAKAEQLAELAGVTLGKATYITESSGSSYQPYPVYAKMDIAAGAGVPETIISSGETDITINVQVNFDIQ